MRPALEKPSKPSWAVQQESGLECHAAGDHAHVEEAKRVSARSVFLSDFIRAA